MPTRHASDPDNCEKLRNKFLLETEQFPEYTDRGKNNKDFGLGGFCALNNASSFHNPTARQLRGEIDEDLNDFLIELQNALGSFNTELRSFNTELLIDRFMLRQAGRKPTAESFHRDDSTGIEGDVILGGWFNFNTQPHVFSCIPKTHVIGGPPPAQVGFNKIPKHAQADMKAKSVQVQVPTGCVILFIDNLIHEVLAKKYNFDMMRLFVGYRLTTDTNSMIPHIDDILTTQAVVPLKSGQMPPMYAMLHLVNWISKLVHFSAENIIPELLVDHTYKSGKLQNQTFRIVKRHLPSLYELSEIKGTNCLYPPYNDDERALYRPTKRIKKN